MDIRKTLQSGHSKRLTTAIVEYIGNDKKRFRELLDIFFEGEYRLTQRAAWPLSYVVSDNPGLSKPYLEKFVERLELEGQHPAVKRNILRFFEDIEIPEHLTARLFDLCLGFIKSELEPVAIRAFAITVASNIAEIYPDLKNELILLLRAQTLQDQTPAIRSRIKKAVNRSPKRES